LRWHSLNSQSGYARGYTILPGGPPADIVGRGQAVMHEILEDGADMLARIGERGLAQIDAIDRDAAFVRLVEPLITSFWPQIVAEVVRSEGSRVWLIAPP